MVERGYQQKYSEINPGMNEATGRQRKAETMRRVLGEALGDRLGSSRLLNLGCSAGLIDEHLAPHVASLVGVDIDEAGIEAAKSRSLGSHATFMVADAMALPFSDHAFDVVICSQVYEHVPDARAMMSEISRVLRPGGVCYFAATNKWSVIEQHYKLPFLSWLPRRMANLYVSSLGRSDEYYEMHLGVSGLKRLVGDLRIDDWTGRILADPERYGCGYMFPGALSRFVARGMLKLTYGLFPGFIWLLWKPEVAGDTSAEPTK